MANSTTTGKWLPLTTTVNIHVGLQFGVNIPEVIALTDGNHSYRNIAKFDIVKGTDVDTRKDLDSFYEVDGEHLVQIAKYSGKEKNVMQCYNGKNKLVDGATVYYTQSGKMFVKSSNRVINTVASTSYSRPDIFANA